MSTEVSDEKNQWFVIVHGIDTETFEKLAIHFGTRRGGARPSDLNRYISIEVQLPDLERSLAWICSNVDGKFRELAVSVSVSTSLSWSEVVVEPSTLAAISAHRATFKVLVMTPPQAKRQSPNNSFNPDALTRAG